MYGINHERTRWIYIIFSCKKLNLVGVAKLISMFGISYLVNPWGQRKVIGEFGVFPTIWKLKFLHLFHISAMLKLNSF
jgi:hypothetical protein